MLIMDESSKGKTFKKKKKDVKGNEQTNLYFSNICYLCMFLLHSLTFKLNKLTVKGKCNLTSFPFFSHISEKTKFARNRIKFSLYRRK